MECTNLTSLLRTTELKTGSYDYHRILHTSYTFIKLADSKSKLNAMYFLVILILLMQTITSFTQIISSSCYTYYKESGKCVSIRKCKPIWKLILDAPRPLPDRLTEYIRNSQCGNPQDQNICCRPHDVEGVITENPNRNFADNVNSAITNHRNLDLIDSRICGTSNTDRISNGNNTSLFEFPWSALLGYEDSLGEIYYRCGGTLITDRFVLTAAHCIQETRTMKLTTVRLGEYDTSTRVDCVAIGKESICAPLVQEVAVETTIVHPDYDKNRYLNDIALIKLRNIVDTSDSSVKPICLPITQQLLRNNPTKFVITGWGTTEDGMKSEKLLKALVSVYPQDRCQEVMSRLSKRVQITEGHFCAGGEGNNVDTCSGDSGGPIQLVSNFNGDTRTVQYGIISFGTNSCGNSGEYPGVYTNLKHFLKWVLDNLST